MYIMGFFNFFRAGSAEFDKKREEQKLEFEREKHEQRLELERRRKEIDILTAEKRAALERARLDYQIKDEERKIKEDFEDYIEDDDDEDSAETKLLYPLLANILSKNNAPVGDNSKKDIETPPNIQAAPAELSLSDEEIDEIIKASPPQYIKAARLMSDEQIKKLIRGRYPTISEDTLARACARIKR